MTRFLVILLFGLTTWACGVNIPTLDLDQQGDSVVVSFETLGEYPTSIGEIQLREAQSGKIIWHVLRVDSEPQLRELRFQAGANPSIVTSVTGPGTFEIATPSNQQDFALTRGLDYELEIWNAPRSASRSIQFRFEQSKRQQS